MIMVSKSTLKMINFVSLFVTKINNTLLLSVFSSQLPQLDAVISWSDAHFWQQGCGTVAGTLHVQVWQTRSTVCEVMSVSPLPIVPSLFVSLPLLPPSLRLLPLLTIRR